MSLLLEAPAPELIEASWKWPAGMKPQAKEAWGQALLNGSHTQGKKWLERDGSYDVLGVLAHIAAQQGIVERIPQSDGRVLYRGADPDLEGYESLSYLPRDVALWARLPFIPKVEVKGIFFPISGLNDGGWKFPELWTLIARQL